MEQFGIIFLFLITSFIFIIVMMGVSRLLRRQSPNSEKLSSYESGENSVGLTQVPFSIKYYTIALVFLLFEVELVLLFPWAKIFGNKQFIEESNGNWLWFSLAEVCFFIFVLALGLLYVWGQGLLNWVKPENHTIEIDDPIPQEEYQKFNNRY